MIPSASEYAQLAGRYQLVPVAQEFFADTVTPVAAFRDLAGGTGSFLLESVEGGERWARFSFIGLDPLFTLRVRGGRVEAEGRVPGHAEDAPDLIGGLRRALGALTSPALPGLPPLHSGLVGYLGYDTVRALERLGPPPPDDLGMPESMLALPASLVAFDHLRQSVTVVANVLSGRDPASDYRAARARIGEIAERMLEGARSEPRPLLAPTPIPAEPNVGDDEFASWVDRAKEHVFAGDIFQVVLSRRFTASAAPDPFDAYRSLRVINPSPYMYFLDFGEVVLAGSSPEVLVRVQDGRAVTHPIAGTRPRGATEEEDGRLEAELLADPKERAEHVMLVDLARNDLGRVSVPGSVRVDELMAVERYSHVMHLTSRVSGTLTEDASALDAFCAAFPAGTVSGAPKVRAMQLIDEMEPVSRGPYAGAVGYVDAAGNLDTCITLRTVVFHRGKAHVQAGAGIVADSDPAAEAAETRHKAEALLAAVGAAAALAP